MTSLLLDAFIYLTAAVLAVPLAQRLGLGSVLGYLLAGIILGPLLGLIGAETREIQHVAEFGVVMMLFLVGLELRPQMLWQMRGRLIGLGGLQVLLTTALLTAGLVLLGLGAREALTIGLILSLSSTAIVLQTLGEKGLTTTDGGRAGFSVLLFQDIAVIPMLALIPLLGVASSGGDAAHGESMSLVAHLPAWAHAGLVIAAVAVVLVGGHTLATPMFRFLARSRLREVFTASALLLVVGIALLMTLVDLSPALGAFLAGVVLANSEFRHELESDIEPFKGLLLGLFFITVGAGIDFGLLFAQPAMLLAATAGLLLVKGLVLYGLARLFGLGAADRGLLALSLAQAGEFAFVLIGFGVLHGALAAQRAGTISLVVALSMLATPLLFLAYDRLAARRGGAGDGRPPDAIETRGPVIIAGNGRFGQVVNRLLIASGVQTVVLDHEAAMIEMLRRFGVTAYYGDASRPDLLIAAGIADASALVIAIDDPDRAVVIAEHVRRHYPQVAVIARAYDRSHLYRLRKAGVTVAERELFEGSLRMGMHVLRALGVHPYKVERSAHAFRRHDLAGLEQLYALWDQNPDLASNQAYLARARAHAQTLAATMEVDRAQAHEGADRGWMPAPGRGDPAGEPHADPGGGLPGEATQAHLPEFGGSGAPRPDVGRPGLPGAADAS